LAIINKSDGLLDDHILGSDTRHIRSITAEGEGHELWAMMVHGFA
jgi:hypothetical protein